MLKTDPVSVSHSTIDQWTMNWKLIWTEITASLSAKQGTNSKGHNHQLMKSCTFIQAMKTVWVTHKYPDHLIKKGRRWTWQTFPAVCEPRAKGSQGNEFCRQLAHFSSALADKLSWRGHSKHTYMKHMGHRPQENVHFPCIIFRFSLSREWILNFLFWIWPQTVRLCFAKWPFQMEELYRLLYTSRNMHVSRRK